MIMEGNEKDSVIQEILAIVNGTLANADKREALDNYHDYDLARALLEMDTSGLDRFYACMSDVQIANVIANLEPEDARDILLESPKRFTQRIFNLLQTDDLVDIIGSITDLDEQITYLSLVSAKSRKIVKEMLEYDDSLVGSIMNINYIEISSTTTVKSAIQRMVALAPETEFINNLYVVDDGLLTGVLSLKEVISYGNRPTMVVADIMSVNIVSVSPWSTIETAIETMKNYDFFLLPVVDKDNRMLGIVAYDDIIEALNRESDEDYSRLAAVTDVLIDQKRETVLTSIKKRVPWLVILLFVNVITSSIITGYESVLAMIPTLAFFMPLILNLSGNTGTQSLGIIIRLFATNQLESRRRILKHLFKEFLTGIINGILIAILLFFLVIALRMVQGEKFVDILPFAFVIGLSIAIALAVATVAGAVVPLLLSVLKVDPAVASGPFITTINDIISLLIYLGLASILLANYF